MRVLVALFAVFLLAACKTQSAPPAPPELEAVLSGYDTARAGLAADRSVGPAAAATRAAAEKAGAALPELQGRLRAIAEAASALEHTAGSDLEAQRVKFGELSRALLALAQSEPGLQRDRHVYECPMARGYRKWVQSKPEMENPYMGKSMLECGTESTWAP